MKAPISQVEFRWGQLSPVWRRWLVDAIAVVLWTGLAIVGSFVWPESLDWLDLVCLCCGAALLVVRRIVPALALAGIGVVSVFMQSADPLPLLMCAAYTAGTRSKRLPGIAATAAAAAAMLLVPMTLWWPQENLVAIGYVSGIIPLVLSATVGLYVRRSRQSASAHRQRLAALERERQMIAERAALDERTRLAQEMHDLLGHKLSLIVLHAGALELASQPNPERAALIRVAGHDAMEDLRRVIGLFHTDGQQPPPDASSASLHKLAAASREAGVPVRCTLDPRLDDLDPETRRAVHRVVQETLTNLHKYAGSAPADLEVTLEGDELRVEVRNDRPRGPAVARGTGSGRGLLGLAERVDLLGGRMYWGPTTDGGFRVQVQLPSTRPCPGDRGNQP